MEKKYSVYSPDNRTDLTITFCSETTNPDILWDEARAKLDEVCDSLSRIEGISISFGGEFEVYDSNGKHIV